MEQHIICEDWKKSIPLPVYEEHPEYFDFYMKAWELAYAHIKDIPGMPQNPYMDEGFCETQVWIWDTCFMALFCKYAQDVFPGVETLRNFYEVLYGGKQLPQVIPPENEPEWTKAIPGIPYHIQVHLADNPPLFAWAEYENVRMSGDASHIRELLHDKEYLQKHYQWLEGLHQYVKKEGVLHHTWILAVDVGFKWEGGCSGMDNTPRGRIGDHVEGQRPNNPNMLWLDAICQQALSAQMIAKLYALVDDPVEAGQWNARYEEKKEIINRFYWDEKDGFYYDIDCNSHDFYKIMTIASYWTMTAQIASQAQAKQLAEQLLNPETLGGAVPFLSLSRSDNDYCPQGQYWRGSMWLPTAYAALKGLANYGMFRQAHTLSCGLLEHMYKTYRDFVPHTIWEAYSPEKCEPATNERGIGEYVRPDFCGWSALGPISVYIEYVLGFHTVDAFEKLVEWEKPENIKGAVGIRNLRFGSIVTDIVADGNSCEVVSNAGYTLKICGRSYEINAGRNHINL